MLYNILGWFVINMFVDIIVCLVELLNVVVLKDVSGDFDVMIVIIV